VLHETGHVRCITEARGVPERKQMAGLADALRALRSRNYRLFFAGQTTSLIGTWMTRLATSWLVYRLTGSAVLLGVVGFCSQIPMLALGPIAGVWVDRWERRRTLILTQIASMLQSLALAALTLSGSIQMWHVIALALAQGVINAIDMPARQSFVIQMVERREDLGNAIALNSSMVNATRLVGPAVAGLVIGAVGEGWCFLIDGVSYVAVIASLVAMRVARVERRANGQRAFDELAEGWRYVRESQPIRAMLLLLAVVSLVGMPYTVLMPIFADRILHGGPHTLGFLMGASGVGALVAALLLATRKTIAGLGIRIATAAGAFGAALIGFALSKSLWLSLAILPFAGFGMMQGMAGTNTILQTIVEDDKRGRVMAYYAMAFQGVAPFGSLLAGWTSDRVGAPATLAVGGAVCVAAAVWFGMRLPSLRAIVRPIYVKLGILQEGELVG
jgi:MFS family permease